MDGITITNNYGERFIVRYHTDIVFGPVFRPLNFRNNILDASGFISRFSMDARSQIKRYLQNHAPSHQAMCYMRPVEEALRAGKLKVYTLGKPVDTVTVNKEKSDLLNQLKMICNRIIAEEEAEKARIAQEHDKKTRHKKNQAIIGAIAAGIRDDVVGAITYSFNVAQVFIPQVRLATAGVNIGLHIQENGLGKINDISDAARQFTILANVVYEGFMKDVKDVVGFDIRDTSKQDIDKAIEVFNVLRGDPATFQVLSNFAERLANSQHELEYVRNGAGIIFGLIVSSVMFYISGGTAAGAAAASLSLIVKATSAMKTLMGKLGEILVKIIEVTAKLPNPIKRKSRRHTENRNPIIKKLEDEQHRRENERQNDDQEDRNDSEKASENKNERSKKESEIVAAPGPTNLMSDSDQFYLNVKKRSDIDPDGYFDVVAHGSPNKIQVETQNGPVLVDHRTAAKLIQNNPDYNGQNIRLLSCNTGSCDNGFAQSLSNKLNVEVKAPTDLIWAYPDGKTAIAPKSTNGQPNLKNLGEMKIFKPKTQP